MKQTPVADWSRLLISLPHSDTKSFNHLTTVTGGGSSPTRIRIIFPCKTYPLIPYFYMAKLGYPGGIPIFLVFATKHKNIDCGYSLEPVPTIYV